MRYKPEQLPLAHRLICARVAKRLSKPEMAEILNTSVETVTAWETGTAKPPQERRQEICDMLYLDRDWLSEEVSPEKLHDPLRDALAALSERRA